MAVGDLLRMTSTSFLLPGNRAWAGLAARYRLAFGAYGDWPDALTSGGSDPLAFILFLADLVTPDALAADPDGFIGDMLGPLDRRLADTTAPTLVAWTSWRHDSPVRNAREKTPWRRLAQCLDQALYARTAAHPGLILVDLDPIFAEIGMAACFDQRNWYGARCRLSRVGLDRVAGAVGAVLDRTKRAARKVLVLDCDNTLWGGVVGEVGLDGLALGQDGPGAMFVAFQHAVADLAAQGVILCLASKNNPEDVWAVFDRHPAMVLRRDRISAAALSWDAKTATLPQLADHLGLGLDSVVFWDDNPMERARMQAECPAVLTPDLPDDVATWPDLLRGLDDLAAFTVTDEDRHKTDQYRHVAAFQAARQQAPDAAAFLIAARLMPTIHPIGPGTLARAAQLCAKTNQFTLRTIRHDAGALTTLAECPRGAAFLVGLSDRFGDHGLVGLVIARPTHDHEIAFLDSFLLSCRVLGRHLEAWMLAETVRMLRTQGFRTLIAEFIDSGRNQVAADFLATHGFTAIAPDDPGVTGHPAAPGGTLYRAALATLSIPHLDVYRHVDPAA